MKIKTTKVFITILTFGLSGYLDARKIVEENRLKERITFSEQILGLMLALPILSVFVVIAGILDGLASVDKLPDHMREFWHLENANGAGIIDIFFWIPQSFGIFIILHLYLSVAFFQHSDSIVNNDRLKVLIFGFYALDWTPSKHLNPSGPEQNRYTTRV